MSRNPVPGNTQFALYVIPFLCAAAVQFMPWWLYAPTCLMLALEWIGCWREVGRLVEKDKADADAIRRGEIPPPPSKP